MFLCLCVDLLQIGSISLAHKVWSICMHPDAEKVYISVNIGFLIHISLNLLSVDTQYVLEFYIRDDCGLLMLPRRLCVRRDTSLYTL